MLHFTKIVGVSLLLVNFCSGGGIPQPEKLQYLERKYNCSGIAECTAASGLRADPVQHFCSFQNPCTIKTTPSYLNWDYVVLDTNNLTSTTPIQLTVANGVADLTWGQGVDQPFLLCCGLNTCYQKEVPEYFFEGKCPPPVNMTVSFWNRNYVEDEEVTLLFNNGVGPGPK